MARNQTPEQLLQRGLRAVQGEIARLEKAQRAAQPCPHCKLAGGLPGDQTRLLIQLVELARKAAADQYDPRRTLAKMTEAELERIAGTKPVPRRDE